MGERAPYSRVYWSIMDDPKFDGVREDPRHLGSWCLLLIVADMAWPAPAFRPPTVPAASFKVLCGAGIVDALPGGRFRIHGLDAERGRRREAARTVPVGPPNGSRLVPEREPTGISTEPKRSLARALDETRRDETRVDEPSNTRDEPHIEAWLMTRHRLPTQRQRDFLDRYLQVFDVTGPQRMAELILRHPNDPIAALKADLDSHREERLGEIAKWSPPPKPKPKREPWQELFRATLEAKEAETLAARPLPVDVETS